MSVTTKSNRNANKYRVVFLGDQGVGKTSIIERYTSGKFDENYNVTYISYIVNCWHRF